MKFKRILSTLLIIAAIAVMAVPAVSAATIKTDDNVSLTVECGKKNYTFEIYQVAKLVSTTESPYETAYKSNVPAISESVLAGDNKAALEELDKIETLPAAAKSYGTFDTNESTEKTFSDLPQGIYYIRAIEYPADVTAFTNSIIALPYYTAEDGWVYSYDKIDLAEKVVETPPVTHKEITNSTKNNVNFTDVSIGDTVNFKLTQTTTGSKQIKLTAYTVYDEQSKGLTLNKESFKVYLADADGKKIEDIKDYNVNVTSEKSGEQTDFNVALSKDYLAKDNFYEANVKNVVIEYSAVLNKYAVIGSVGNPNEDVKLEYGNRSKKDSVPGNTVYVYTYAVGVDKLDENGKKLAGATFELYKTEADANGKKNAIATGTSDSNGKVAFMTEGTEIKLQSGTYYIAETAAPSGYNLYGKVITVNIDATYLETIANGTYVDHCPAEGKASVTVTDTKVFLPKTGGRVEIVYAVGGALLLLSGVALFFLKRSKKKAEENDK